MPTDVTEVDEHTATIPVPNDTEDADAASLLAFAQPLANRSLNAKNRLDTLDTEMDAVEGRLDTKDAEEAYGVRYVISGSGLSVPGAKFTLTYQEGDNTNYTLASDEVTVPKNGRYRVAVLIQLTEDTATTNPKLFAVSVSGASGFGPGGVAQRWSASTSDRVGIAFASTVRITDKDAQTLSVQLQTSGDISVPASSSYCLFAIDYLGPN